MNAPKNLDIDLNIDDAVFVDDANDTVDAVDVTDTGHNTDIVRMYLQDIKLNNALNVDDEKVLFEQLKNGCDVARKTLLSRSLPLVVNIAKKYQYRGLPFADIIGEGNLGLIHALEKFDPEKGFRFSTYATWWIQHSIKKAIMESRTVRLPAHLIRSISFVLIAKKTQSDFEVAKSMNLSIADVHKFVTLSQHTNSLDQPFGNSESTLIDLLESESNHVDQLLAKERSRFVMNGLLTLSEREHYVLRKRFGFDDEDAMSLDEIASLMELSRESVRIIQNHALKKLKKQFVNYIGH